MPGVRTWRPGDRLTHRDNPDLGPGRVLSVEPRTLLVEFPGAGTRLRLAAGSAALVPLELRPGRRLRHLATGREGVLAEILPDGRLRLEDGAAVPAAELWPADLADALVERLAAGETDPLEDFDLRLSALHLSARREAEGLGSFLGGRIRLFPHQLHAAERACRSDPVRWLLADEVGLGKTVEACLVLNRLLHGRGVERCLVVAPRTLVVQWLGELWRKHHQVFVLLDEDRLADVARDFGPSFNPFDVHRRVVLALEDLVDRPLLTRHAVSAGVDVLVVDEAHRLRRPRGHPGDPAYRAVEPIARLGRHVLLLTATPLEDDAHGFFRLLQLLRPEELSDEGAFEARLARAEPLPPCTSSTRREDVGGLPPRRSVPVEAGGPEAWAALRDLEEAIRAEPAEGPLARRRKSDRLRRALASGPALGAALAPAETGLAARAARATDEDPRLRWLASQAPRWRAAGEKTLVFVQHAETLDWLRDELSRRSQLATAAFHERLSPGRRDIEVAHFRLPTGPSLLLSTECGGEGRNFEFCTRLVLFDLPWSPVAVEQRIGRLDRIGRSRDVEVVAFVPPGGLGRDLFRVLEAVGVLREPLAGLEPELASLEAAFDRAALDTRGPVPVELLEEAVAEAHAARARVREAAYRELHRDRYRPGMAADVLAGVPPDLEELNEEVVIGACGRLSLSVEPQASRGLYSVELGSAALVDELPGVPGGSSFLGTFDREQAVADESLDFFATGHPLVEGVLAHLEESPRGRVTLLSLRSPEGPGLALLALYRDGPGFEAVVVDASGRRRPEWAAALTRRPLRSLRVNPALAGAPGWGAAVRRLAGFLETRRRPVAVAAVLVSP